MLTRSGDGWQLAPTSVSFSGGRAVLSGRSGSRPEVHAQLQYMPLEVLDLGWPNLDFSGVATGRLDYAWKGNRSGRADLKIRGLSRAGLVLASKPIDVGLAAVVSGTRRPCARSRSAAGRPSAVRRRGSRRSATATMAELFNAPFFAQLRYAGPADTLVAPVGNRALRPYRPGRDRRRHRRAPRRPGHPRLGPHQHRAARKRGHRHADRTTAGGRAVQRLAADLHRLAGTTAGGGAIEAPAPSTSPAALPRSTCPSTLGRRCCSTATISPRG